MMTVNISGRQFQETNFVEKVKQVLAETGIPSSRLEIEITETIATKNVDLTNWLLKELQAIAEDNSEQEVQGHFLSEALSEEKITPFLLNSKSEGGFFAIDDPCFQLKSAPLYASGRVAAIEGPDDLVARYGGEEFAIVLPNTQFFSSRGHFFKPPYHTQHELKHI
ncbi:EAL domain-containing protein [Dactylococcopsis salina]|uniref:EAL domain-containing protein n=1 Tax=Dactylococcopsis salina TaxID=292566 RepID=UPI0003054C8A|nr:EAL domain-containing protein [Dactylococcopsis salina]